MTVEKRVCATAHGGGIPVLNDPRASTNPTAYNQTTELLSWQWTIEQIQSRTTGPRNVNALQDIPGICPNISANPPRVSRSGFILVGKKALSWKKSVLIPWVIGGIKTPKSCKEQKKNKNKTNFHICKCQLYKPYQAIDNLHHTYKPQNCKSEFVMIIYWNQQFNFGKFLY